MIDHKRGKVKEVYKHRHKRRLFYRLRLSALLILYQNDGPGVDIGLHIIKGRLFSSLGVHQECHFVLVPCVGMFCMTKLDDIDILDACQFVPVHKGQRLQKLQKMLLGILAEELEVYFRDHLFVSMDA